MRPPPAEPAPVQALARQAADRAKALYDSREMLCSEAVLVALNEVFDAGLTREQARATGMAHGFAFGGSGCLCGAVNGAITAASLLLAKRLSPKALRQAARQLHETLNAEFGSSCCRALIREVKDDKAAHFAQCAGLTRQAAWHASLLVLGLRPELAARTGGLSGRVRPSGPGSRLASLLRRLADRLG